MTQRAPIALASLAFLYVLVVLLVDTLAMQRLHIFWDWQEILWTPRDLYQLIPDGFNAGLVWLSYPPLQAFDLYKFGFWLLLPLLCCARYMDWGWLGAQRMQRKDWLGLAVIAVLGALAMAIIPWVPALSFQYPTLGHFPAAAKWDYLQGQLFWILSWLLGWEFLHRYVLLKASLRLPFSYGWLLVPLVEGLYHLQKPLLEAAGMVALSVLLTLWTLRRRTLLPALRAHLIIELELLVYQLL